jgi:hypothetical protein
MSKNGATATQARMSRRKAMGMTLAASGVAGVLAACAPGRQNQATQSAAPATIRWAIHEGLAPVQAEAAKLYAAQRPNVTLVPVTFSDNAAMLTEWLGGAGPDVATPAPSPARPARAPQGPFAVSGREPVAQAGRAVAADQPATHLTVLDRELAIDPASTTLALPYLDVVGHLSLPVAPLDPAPWLFHRSLRVELLF